MTKRLTCWMMFFTFCVLSGRVLDAGDADLGNPFKSVQQTHRESQTLPKKKRVAIERLTEFKVENATWIDGKPRAMGDVDVLEPNEVKLSALQAYAEAVGLGYEKIQGKKVERYEYRIAARGVFYDPAGKLLGQKDFGIKSAKLIAPYQRQAVAIDLAISDSIPPGIYRMDLELEDLILKKSAHQTLHFVVPKK